MDWAMSSNCAESIMSGARYKTAYFFYAKIEAIVCVLYSYKLVPKQSEGSMYLDNYNKVNDRN